MGHVILVSVPLVAVTSVAPGSRVQVGRQVTGSGSVTVLSVVQLGVLSVSVNVSVMVAIRSSVTLVSRGSVRRFSVSVSATVLVASINVSGSEDL